MFLRHYQTDVVSRVLGAIASHNAVVLQMPTGSGKTITAVEVVKGRIDHGTVWFICHRREIIRQTCKVFQGSGVDFGVIAPGYVSDVSARIQIASVDTIRRRPSDFPVPKTIIWDECQHNAAGTWAKLFAHFPDAVHIGLTATPERLDGKGLSDWFTDMVCGPSISELIESGHLSPFRFFAPHEPDLSEAKTRAGEYQQEDLENTMNRKVVIGDAVDHYTRIMSGKRALAFCVSIDASRALVNRFNESGVSAAHVDGSTPTDERDAAVEDLKSGRILVLSNVNVFTEGVDIPTIDGVILLRPTKSLALYLQMIGRALRPADGKDSAVIMDHSGLVYEHGFPDAGFEWSLEGGARRRRIAGARQDREVIRKCPQCSCAHGAATECPECGYEYPTGRDVGEYDGVLYELRGGVPEGYETVSGFAKMVGRDKSTVSGWGSRGLIITPAGWINVRGGMAWVMSNHHRFCSSPPMFVESPDDYEPQVTFAKRVGVTGSTIRKWCAKGLPCAANGWVHVEHGIRWLKVNHHKFMQHPPMFVENTQDYETRAEFGKRNGVGCMTVAAWADKGLLCAANGWVHVEHGIRWLKANHHLFKTKPPLFVEDAGDYESQIGFGKRIGYSGTTIVRWQKLGLPCAPNGWVHISDGLRWVQENIKTEIPLSAWEGIETTGDCATVVT